MSQGTTSPKENEKRAVEQALKAAAMDQLAAQKQAQPGQTNEEEKATATTGTSTGHKGWIQKRQVGSADITTGASSAGLPAIPKQEVDSDGDHEML